MKQECDSYYMHMGWNPGRVKGEFIMILQNELHFYSVSFAVNEYYSSRFVKSMIDQTYAYRGLSARVS